MHCTLLVYCFQCQVKVYFHADQAVTWFKSYLSNRSQHIVICNAKSDSFNLKCGVPQGSCLGQMLFSLYTSELFDVISQHLPTAHSYADDSDQDTTMEACLCDVRSWMIKLNDKLMISDSKTEFMLIGSKAQLQKTKITTVTIGESIISPSTEPLRNLGAWFDCHFNLNFNITETCRSAFFHLHNIRRVRKYLSIQSAEK